MRRSSLFLPVAALCLLAISSDAHNINRRGAISVQDDTEGPVFMDSFDDFFKKGSWLNFKPKELTPVEEAAAVANEEVVRSGGDGQVPDGIIPDGATVAAPIPNEGQAEMSKTPVPSQQVPNRQDPGAQQAPNKQMPNSQAPNKQMPNSQVPNQPVQNASATDPSSFEEVVRQERNVGQYQPAPERPTYPGYLGVAQNQQKRPQNVDQHNGNRNNQYNYRPQYNQQKPIYRPQYNKQKPIYRPRYPQQPAYPSHAPYSRPQQQQYRPIPVPQRPQYSPFPINPYKFMQQQQHNHASHSHGTPRAGVPNKYVAPNKDGTEAPNKAKGY